MKYQYLLPILITVNCVLILVSAIVSFRRGDYRLVSWELLTILWQMSVILWWSMSQRWKKLAESNGELLEEILKEMEKCDEKYKSKVEK